MSNNYCILLYAGPITNINDIYIIYKINYLNN